MENIENKEVPALPVEIKKKSGFLGFLDRRRWWIVGGFIVLLIAGGVLASGGSEDIFTYAEVQKGDLIQTVEVSGELESFQEADLAFEMSGTVSYVFVQAGDEVVEGQTMAVLVSGELLADLSASQQAAYLAEANLNQFLAGATDQEIAAAQASLDSATADLGLKTELAELNVAEALVALQASEGDLENTLADSGEDSEQVYEDLENLLFGAVIDVRSALSAADEILGVENSLTNQDFENVLSATDPQQYTSAKNYYAYAADMRDASEDLVYALTADSTSDEMYAAADKVEEALDYTSETLLYTRRVLDATKSDSTALSLSDIATYKAAIDTERDTIQTEETALLAQRQLIDSTVIGSDDADDTAAYAYEAAQQDYAQAVSSASSSVAIAQATLDLRQAEYDSLTVEKRSVDTAAYYAQVGQAQAQLAAAEARFEKSEITAPFDGIVTHMDLSMGEPVVLGATVAGVQSSIEQYRVLVDVPEADIVKLTLDDEAIVTFDAYGDDIEVPARVGKINPGESDIEGVVYYGVEIYVNEDIDLALKSGMSADVVITTETKSNALYIQQRAVYEHSDGTRYVRVPNGDEYEEQTIVTGLRADGGYVELISGLEEGDRVITAIND
ncbi:efflux RND transporter periplasmic adaptor subunit [Candidatus Uhrbacteria bacterium]|nr:efflux RND transporter periplasmic adaptor subunit [Candidatus Uhrbacteria bacterium]MBT7717239.1 efflux RND transporter periplasmic adaptor subunit [Candidatus Uhrbacteria bacterium]